MGKEDIKKFQFPKGISGNPKGRPKKYTTLLKASGYSISQINDSIQVMLSMTLNELKIVSQDDSATMLERTISTAMIKSQKNGSLFSLETLLSRAFGQPKQEMSTELILPQPLFPDVIRKKSDPK